MAILKKWTKDQLNVEIHDTRAEMGQAAGHAAADHLRRLLAEKDEVNVIFAAAPSQNEMLAALTSEPDIAWNRVNAFHMDEYIGLSADAPQGFGNFLNRYLFSLVPFRAVYRIDCTAADPKAECTRYTALLQTHPTDLVCLGIGENGHIAFNDPGFAKFDDPEMVKVVTLDAVCRMQQVHDGCFASLDLVPTHALTLTVPTLAKAPHLVCTVPAASKCEAVYQTVEGPVTEDVPATIMRCHPDCVMYCDADSGRKLLS
ncbi:MAG: glucosamine-6-phosphate deaminase [Clostridia bacterium]|nr:glucosamine-6-phosphate deaminase [Clostridia bacterium]